MKALLWGGPRHNKIYQVADSDDIDAISLPQKSNSMWTSIDSNGPMLRHVKYSPIKISYSYIDPESLLETRTSGTVWVCKDIKNYNLGAIVKRLAKMGAVSVEALDIYGNPVLD
jgi:hypothetical protein